MSRVLAVSLISLFCAGRQMIAPAPVVAETGPVTPGLRLEEFIFTGSPFAQCHASTIVETGAGLATAWFGGSREGDPDVGIWLSRLEKDKWTSPTEVANGVQPSGKRYPCWNPVLFKPEREPLILFYKVGPDPGRWWGMMTVSQDDGRTWSRAIRLPEGIWGPIKNKPVRLGRSLLLCPSSSEDKGWRVFIQSTSDWGHSWSSVGPLNKPDEFSAIQPTILLHRENKLQILCRSRQNRIIQCWSEDSGRTWTNMTTTGLPNPNSGLDAVTLRDGRHLLVYNHAALAADGRNGPRSPLNVALSVDGTNWQAALVLENSPGEYSYPAVIQTSDGLVHVTYTYLRRRIKHVVLEPSKLELQPIRNGTWPEE